MARGGFSRRGSGRPPFRLIGIFAGIIAVGLVAALFWFSGQAESHKPQQTEIRVEATNVGPH